MSTFVHVVSDFSNKKTVNLVTRAYSLMEGQHVVVSIENSWSGKPLFKKTNLILHGLGNVSGECSKGEFIRIILQTLPPSHVMAYSPMVLERIKKEMPELSFCLIRGWLDLMRCCSHIKQPIHWKSFFKKNRFFWQRRSELRRDYFLKSKTTILKS